MPQTTSLVSALTRDAGGRLFGVFWGSLVMIDLATVTHAPSDVGTGGVVLVVVAGSWRQTTPTVLAAAGMGWLFVNGFLVNRLGELSWDGLPDLGRLVLFAAVAWAASRTGDLDGFLTRVRERRRSARVPSRDAPGHPGQSVGRERHAAGR
ncbi:MAG TPA: hypothetical protein VF165_20310 [Nocardioidaceae bacterium]